MYDNYHNRRHTRTSLLLWGPRARADVAVAMGSHARTSLSVLGSRKRMQMLRVRDHNAAHERGCFRCGAAHERCCWESGSLDIMVARADLGLAMQIYTMLVGWAFTGRFMSLELVRPRCIYA